MRYFVLGFLVSTLLSTGAAWAFHAIGHNNPFTEGSFLDRLERQDDFEKAKRFEQLRQRQFLNPC